MNTSTQTISHKLCRCSNIYGKDECSIQNSKEIHFQWLLRIINLLYILYIYCKETNESQHHQLSSLKKRHKLLINIFHTNMLLVKNTYLAHMYPPIYLMIFKYNHLQGFLILHEIQSYSYNQHCRTSRMSFSKHKPSNKYSSCAMCILMQLRKIVARQDRVS